MPTNLNETSARAILTLVKRAKNPMFGAFTIAQAAQLTGRTVQQVTPMITDLVSRGWLEQNDTEYRMNHEQADAALAFVLEYVLDRLSLGGLL